MNRRAAMREAHRIAAAILRQAQLTAASGWADDEADHDAIDAALTELAERHVRYGGEHRGGRA